jgi:cell division protein FtsQ
MTRSTDRSRADLVRRRRGEQTHKRLSESSVLATRPLTPITSRAARGSLVTPSLPPAAAKRRYQAAISMPGIQVQMPVVSFTGPGVKWRLLSFAICLLLGGALYLAWTAPALRASAADISGNQRIAAEEIDAALAVGGRPIFTLVPAKLETRLRLNYPELQAAHVSLALPNRVIVNVVERAPAIVWQQDGAYTWIDGSGVAFRPRGAADNLIAVEAAAAPAPGSAAQSDPLSPAPYLSADLVAAVKKLAPGAPQGTPLMYDPRYGLGWTDSRGWQVFFGTSAGSMELKLQVYRSLVTMLDLKGIVPAFISVAYPSAPYYRMNH